MTVWLVTHEHRHGRDVSACATEARALRLAREIVEENLDDEVDSVEDRDAILALLASGEVRAASRTYCDATGGGMSEREEIAVEEVEVLA